MLPRINHCRKIYFLSPDFRVSSLFPLLQAISESGSRVSERNDRQTIVKNQRQEARSMGQMEGQGMLNVLFLWLSMAGKRKTAKTGQQMR